MIEPQPKDFYPLEKSLRIPVNPRTVVLVESGFVNIYSRGQTVTLSEWEFNEVAAIVGRQRVHEVVERHAKKTKKKKS